MWHSAGGVGQYSVVQCGTVWCGTVWCRTHGGVKHSMAQCGTEQQERVLCGTAWQGTGQQCVVWYGMAWHDSAMRHGTAQCTVARYRTTRFSQHSMVWFSTRWCSAAQHSMVQPTSARCNLAQPWTAPPYHIPWESPTRTPPQDLRTCTRRVLPHCPCHSQPRWHRHRDRDSAMLPHGHCNPPAPAPPPSPAPPEREGESQGLPGFYCIPDTDMPGPAEPQDWQHRAGPGSGTSAGHWGQWKKWVAILWGGTGFLAPSSWATLWY